MILEIQKLALFTKYIKDSFALGLISKTVTFYYFELEEKMHGQIITLSVWAIFKKFVSQVQWLDMFFQRHRLK